MTAPDEWRVELERIETALVWAWLEGPSFRDRWTPEPSDFSTDRTAAMAKACRAMLASGLRPSPGIQLVDALRTAGDLRKHWTAGRGPVSVPSAAPDEDLGRWLTLRLRFALRQRLVELVLGMTLGGDLSGERKALLEAITSSANSGRAPATSLPDGLLAAYQEGTRHSSRSYSTGFTELDALTGGCRPGHVWAIGAPTNWGKSSLLLALADHHLQTHSTGALLVTCEDAPSLLFSRWLARRASISGRALRDARLSDDEHERAVQAVNDSHAAGVRPVILDGRGRPVEQIARDVAAHVATHTIGLVLVDYLQCITSERVSQDRRTEINHVARTMTDVIKTSGAAGVLASQLTGEDLRESRDVEHAAEVVLIGRKAEDGSRSLFLKKNKTGPADAVVMLEWDSESGSFTTHTPMDYGIPDAD
jgi:replicative DNA helicase